LRTGMGDEIADPHLVAILIMKHSPTQHI
jgi:hypothetical protein